MTAAAKPSRRRPLTAGPIFPPRTLQSALHVATVVITATALNPLTPDAVSLLATPEFANKEYDKALADVERTHELPNHEQFAEVHIMAGKVLRMRNQREAAKAQFQMFLKEKPDSPLGGKRPAGAGFAQRGQQT